MDLRLRKATGTTLPAANSEDHYEDTPEPDDGGVSIRCGQRPWATKVQQKHIKADKGWRNW